MLQVHHGGAGTTAAGLKAAVNSFNALCITVDVLIFFHLLYFACFMYPLVYRYLLNLSASVQLLLFRFLATNPSGESECTKKV